MGGSRWRIRRTILDEGLPISLAGSIAAGLLLGIVWIIAVRESTVVRLDLEIPTGILVLIPVLGAILGDARGDLRVITPRRPTHRSQAQAADAASPRP